MHQREWRPSRTGKIFALHHFIKFKAVKDKKLSFVLIAICNNFSLFHNKIDLFCFSEINAFIYDATVLEYLASHDDGCKLRTVGNWYAMTGYGIGFPKGSKWGAIMNKILVQLQYDGQLMPSIFNWFFYYFIVYCLFIIDISHYFVLNHHHHFLPRLIKGMNGCFPTA